MPVDTLLPPRVAAAAAAIANARGARKGVPEVGNILDLVERTMPDTFAEVVEDAYLAVRAADQADAATPPQPRRKGPLRNEDAAALGLDLGCRSVLILAVSSSGELASAGWVHPGSGTQFTEAAMRLVGELCHELGRTSAFQGGAA